MHVHANLHAYSVYHSGQWKRLSMAQKEMEIFLVRLCDTTTSIHR